jgi:hypothetical protein
MTPTLGFGGFPKATLPPLRSMQSPAALHPSSGTSMTGDLTRVWFRAAWTVNRLRMLTPHRLATETLVVLACAGSP